jgi:hypothetical protein
MEKRPPTGDGEQSDSAASTAEEATNEQSSEQAVSSSADNKPATTTANDPVTQQPPEEPVSSESTKNPAAVSLGRLGGLKGGKARARTLTKRERSNAARKAARARWQKKKTTK